MEEEKEKFCPILSIEGGSLEPCIEEYCAWYNKDTGRCAILEINRALVAMLYGVLHDRKNNVR